MFQLSRGADYGIRLMIEVAASNGAPLTTAAVAKRQGMPYQYLRKVVQALVSRGLLAAERGVGGGLALARPAEAISLLDVVYAFEAPGLNRCAVEPSRCERRNSCPVYPVWIEAQRVMEQVLGSALLSRMVESQARSNQGRRVLSRSTRPVELATVSGHRGGLPEVDLVSDLQVLGRPGEAPCS